MLPGALPIAVSIIHVIVLMYSMKIYHATRTQEATYICGGNASDTSLMHFTFRLRSVNDTVVELFGYDASTSVSAAGRKSTCKSTSGDGSDGNPFQLSMDIDTDSASSRSSWASKCGVYDLGSHRVYRFRIRSIGDLALDTPTDAYYNCECDTNNLLAVWKSATVYTSNLKEVYIQQNHLGASLRVVDASSNLPASSVGLGAEVFLQVLYNPKTVDDSKYDSCGKEFWIAFLDLGYTTPKLKLRITSATTIKSKISFWTSTVVQIIQPVTVDSLSEIVVTLPWLSAKGKGIHVISSENIYMLAESSEGPKVSVHIVYPHDTLGNSYRIVTGLSKSQVIVLGTNDSTSVTITSPVSFDINGVTKTANTPLTISLQKFELLRLKSSSDITNTKIESTSDVAVFIGNDIINSNSDVTSFQSVQDTKAGSSYVMIPSKGGLKCVTVTAGSTTVKYRNSTGCDCDVTLTKNDPGKFEISSESTSYFEIGANKRISCIAGFPLSTFVLPPKQQWSSSYMFSVDSNMVLRTFVHIVIENGTHTGLFVNGNALTTGGWTKVESLTSNSKASTLIGTKYQLTSGLGSPIRLYHDTATFMALLSFEDTTHFSATVPPGIHMSDIYTLSEAGCIKTYGYSGDLVDNDCDGDVDEDESATADVLNLDLKATIVDKVNALGVRPVECLANPTGDWAEGGINKTVTLDTGCIPTGNNANPFTPSTTFKLISPVGSYPAVYNTGTFRIPRFSYTPDVHFRCMLEFCFRSDDTSCTTHICQNARKKRSTSTSESSTDINTSVTVTDRDTDSDTDDPLPLVCTEDRGFLVVISLLSLILFFSLLITLGLYRRVRHKLGKTG